MTEGGGREKEAISLVFWNSKILC